MLKFVVIYFSIQLVIIIGAITLSWWRRRRRLKPTNEQSLDGFEKTAEVFIDPTTGIKQHVWFNPRTGERLYK